MICLGDQLEKLCALGRQDVVLVAPFVKAGALARVVAKISDGVTLRCVTRWRPDEIALGVSDIEIWPFLKERPDTSLWLRNELHAKYYRADDVCLVGSANLTSTALGWVSRANLELLVSMDAEDLRYFEDQLFRGSVVVDDDIYTQTLTSVAQIRPYISLTPVTFHGENIGEEQANEPVSLQTMESWVPRLRNPLDLYLAYSGRNEELSVAARSAAAHDLQALSLPWGLPRESFEVYVGTLLLQSPTISTVDKFVRVPQRFGAVRQFLKTLPCAHHMDFDATIAWQTLMRWLLYFLPSRYELVPSRHSEVFGRVVDKSYKVPGIEPSSDRSST